MKDPQWALDLLERNPSWRLVLIGPDFPADPGPMIEDYVRRFRERLQQPSLAARVDMTGDTEDVAGALTGVGIILSASLREGMPVGLFEGAASGAVPVVRDWPLLSDRGGARSVVPPEWVVEDVAGAEERIRSVTSTTEAWERTRREVQRLVREAIDPAGVAEMYRALVLGRAGE